MVAWPSIVDIEGPSPHQLAALDRCLRSNVGILTGGPGTGKTRTAAALLSKCVEQLGSHKVAVVAPTGKAGINITGALYGSGVYLEATTIHRRLGVSRNGHDQKGWGFTHNRTNPLKIDVLAVEEASMVGTPLGASLFEAVEPGTLVLLLGDDGQLPPVEHGAMLRDMKAAGVPCGELTEIWRNSGDIVRSCMRIRAGQGYHPSTRTSLAGGNNLKHVESARADRTLRHLDRLISNVPSSLNAINDVQVLCAINVPKSDLSRHKLNARLQEILNPNGDRLENAATSRFRINDKVICTSNTILEATEIDDGMGEGEEVYFDEGDLPKVFVVNGDMGQVVGIEPKVVYVEFTNPRRVVLVPSSELSLIDLGYAITVHKSQGCSWPVVIYVSDDYSGARFVSSRELIYTALSRAETLAMTIGKLATINEDCQRSALAERKTFLAEQLRMAA